MSEKRKDHKGRILRTGESQRKDLIYQYRYTDVQGKRQTIYSSDLKELREKEKEIQKQLDEGIDYAAGKATVIALVERYISLKNCDCPACTSASAVLELKDEILK